MEYQKFFGLAELNMNVIQADEVTLTPTWQAKNVVSSFTRVYMITDGVGWLRYGEINLKMTKGNIYIVPAGLKFSYDCENGFSKIYFHISLRQTGGFDIFEGFDSCIEINDPKGIELTKGNFKCDTIYKIATIKSYLYSLVSQCIKDRENTKIQKYSEYVTDIMDYAGKNLSANLTAEKIADALYTSPGKLRKVFKKETGISIGKYIDDRVMFTAELEVRCGKLSIKEISDYLGFCDQFYFSRCFTKKYGISPLKYRKEQTYN